MIACMLHVSLRKHDPLVQFVCRVACWVSWHVHMHMHMHMCMHMCMLHMFSTVKKKLTFLQGAKHNSTSLHFEIYNLSARPWRDMQFHRRPRMAIGGGMDRHARSCTARWGATEKGGRAGEGASLLQQDGLLLLGGHPLVLDAE